MPLKKEIPLSVFIITKNEAKRISRTIESIKDLTDDIVVVDCGSTDGTVKLAESLGARTFHQEWKGYGPQKKYAESLCLHDWVLNLDADEELSLKLRKSIKSLFSKELPHPENSYKISIEPLTLINEKKVKFGPRSEVIRLYNRKCATFRDDPVFDTVIARSAPLKVKKLKGAVLHRTFHSFSQMIEKMNFYTSMQADHMIEKGKKVSKLRFFYDPILSFLKAYFLRRYFLVGYEGVILSFHYAAHRLYRLAKFKELESKKRKFNDKPESKKDT